MCLRILLLLVQCLLRPGKLVAQPPLLRLAALLHLCCCVSILLLPLQNLLLEVSKLLAELQLCFLSLSELCLHGLLLCLASLLLLQQRRPGCFQLLCEYHVLSLLCLCCLLCSVSLLLQVLTLLLQLEHLLLKALLTLLRCCCRINGCS